MSRTSAGLRAGAVAGMAMAVVLMAWTRATTGSAWRFPNLVAAFFLGDDVAGTDITLPTMLGLAMHVAASALLGAAIIPLLRDLPVRRKIATAVVAGLAAYPLVYTLILSWAHPLMVEQAELVPMTLAHAAYGGVLGAVYIRLRQGVRASNRPR